MYDRIEKLIGSSNLEKIRNKTVVIVGLGGVGGFAAESLVRSGIENLIVIDYDKIDISNLNRQIITTTNNIDQLKVDEFSKRAQQINPKINITKLNWKLDSENVSNLFKYHFDYLIDCCDTLTVKEKLIEECLKHNIVFISSMAMGNKKDPSKLEISDISKTSYDPIAKKIRKYLKDNKISGKVPVVYSKEQGKKFTGSIPSMIFVPSVCGILCANYIVMDIIKE